MSRAYGDANVTFLTVLPALHDSVPLDVLAQRAVGLGYLDRALYVALAAHASPHLGSMGGCMPRAQAELAEGILPG